MTATRAPEVSVLLPVFNGERYVREAVRSVLEQTVPDFELIVIDDGSTDRSLQILSRLAANDGRIRLVSRPNRGLVRTLNEMLQMARGTFIARMDADDRCTPHRFERQLRALREDASLVAVGSAVHFMDPASRHLMTFTYPQTHADIDAWMMAVERGCAMSHPALMMRAATLRAIGDYREEFWPAEDADLVFRLAEHGRVANLVEPLLSYRLHSQSVSHRHTRSQRDAHYRAAAAAATRRCIPAPDPALGSVEAVPPESERSRSVKYAWWALASGQVTTARVHAFKALLRSPFAPDALRVFACALRGR
jgi:glycosyltransferase involved in cell wall biosynthesis